MTVPKRVFLSHTGEFGGYPPQRSFIDAAVNAVNAAGHQATDMRNFPARDQDPGSLCIERVRGHDVYVGIIGFRYGSPVRDRPDVSYTELEFEAATEARLARLIFMLAEDAEVTPRFVIDPDYGKRQETFRKRLADAGVTIRPFRTVAELEAQIEKALRELDSTSSVSRPSGKGLVVTWLPTEGLVDPEFLYIFPGGSHGSGTLLLKNDSSDSANVSRIQLETAILQTLVEGEDILGTEVLPDFPLHFAAGDADEETNLSWQANGPGRWLIDIPFTIPAGGELTLPSLSLDVDDSNQTAVTEVRNLFGVPMLKVEYRVAIVADRLPTRTTLTAPLRVIGGLEEDADGGIGLLVETLAPADAPERERLRALYQHERLVNYQTRAAIARRLNEIEQRKALDQAERAAARHPKDPVASYQLGLQLLAAERAEEALRAFDRAVELGGDDADVAFGRSRALRALTSPEEALAAIDRVVKDRPTDGSAHAERGAILIDLDRPSDAIGAFDTALRLGETADAHTGRGLALWMNDADQEALDAADRAVALDPDQARAHVLRACVLATLEKETDALEAARNALVAGLGSAKPLRLIGDLLSEQGKESLQALAASWGLAWEGATPEESKSRDKR